MLPSGTRPSLTVIPSYFPTIITATRSTSNPALRHGRFLVPQIPPRNGLPKNGGWWHLPR